MKKVKIIPFSCVSYDVQMETRNWRNSEEVTKYFQIRHITEEMHKKWLASLNNTNPRNVAFLIKYGDEYIGVTYFHSIDYEKKIGDWGIYIYNVELRGKGIGYGVLSECIKYAKEKLYLNTLYLDVLNTNIRAIRLYEKFGFKQISINDGGFFRYENRL